MSSQRNQGEEDISPEERRAREEMRRLQASGSNPSVAGLPTGSLLSRLPTDETARQALANQLSSASTFLPQAAAGNQPSASSAIDPLHLQLLRQRAGIPGVGAAAAPNLNVGAGLDVGNVAGGLGGLPSYLQEPQHQSVRSSRAQALAGSSSAEAELREAQANLREANLRLLIAQQRQQQHQQRLLPDLQQAANAGFASAAGQSLHLPLSQAHALSLADQTTAGSAAPAPPAFAEQLLALQGLGGLGSGGAAPAAAALPSLSLQGNDNNQQLSQLLGVNPSGGPALNAALHLQQQHIQGASLRQATGPGIPALAASADLSRASLPPAERPQPADDQPEMKDAEYFELFGFNDEDAVQIINETFPHKLYRMLFEVEKNGQESIVSFFPHGKAFIVHDTKRFVDEIMPRYFSTSRMSSFQRQLNLYGFQRIDDGPEKGGFVHQYFQKGQRSLCNKIRRQRGRSQSATQSAMGLPAAAAAAANPSLGAGRGSPQEQLAAARSLQGRPGADAAAAVAAAQASLPQSQQAQAVLQYLLNQQQQQQQQNQQGDSNPSNRPR